METACTITDEGIPKFWLQAMSNNETVAQAISDQDSAILQYLTDIRSQTLRNNGETTGFKLTFSFAENPYFPEKVTGLCYYVRPAPAFALVGSQRACPAVGIEQDVYPRGRCGHGF